MAAGRGSGRPETARRSQGPLFRHDSPANPVRGSQGRPDRGSPSVAPAGTGLVGRPSRRANKTAPGGVDASGGTAAIIVAAGPGSRLGAEIPKAFVELAGSPLVIRALRGLLEARTITSAVIVVPPTQAGRARMLVATHGPWRCPVSVTPGGAERQDSVRKGLAAVGNPALIAIHDAARPFVSADAVEAAIAAAARHGAAIVARPATDTVKHVHPQGWIESTPPRERTWLAQTPQVFRAEIIRAAHKRASRAIRATDDAMLVEQLGVRVYVVPGNPENRKITTPDDLRWAEWLLAQSAAPR
jgi:2-C-methyl-D-erythritol 4-phosphate cytidylyltransferase